MYALDKFVMLTDYHLRWLLRDCYVVIDVYFFPRNWISYSQSHVRVRCVYVASLSPSLVASVRLRIKVIGFYPSCILGSASYGLSAYSSSCSSASFGLSMMNPADL